MQGNRDISAAEAALIERGLREAAAEATAQLKRAARSDIRVECLAAIRYLGQTHHLDIPLSAELFGDAQFRSLVEAFQKQYASLLKVSEMGNHRKYY